MTHSFGEGPYQHWSWAKVFSIICWLLWKNRCTGVMEGTRLQAQEIRHQTLCHLMETTTADTLKHKIFGYQGSQNPDWTPPPDGFVRLDTDGSVNGQHQATCGGVIRDTTGNWLLGFQEKLGYIPVTTAELKGIYAGLKLCKAQGYTKVEAYTDSMEAYQLIMQNGNPSHPLRQELNSIRELIYSNWELEIKHCPREAIKCADQLAKEAHDMEADTNILSEPSPSCINILIEDQRGRRGQNVGLRHL